MNKTYIHSIIFFLVFSTISLLGLSQSRTFKGQIIDASNKQGVYRATVSYVVDGFAKGITSDDNGYFTITVPQGIDSLKISHIAYKQTMKSIRFIKTKTIKIILEPHTAQLKEVVITAKKEKYSNKNNPAVDLIRKVIENRDKNSILQYCPLHYSSHNKSLIALDPVNDTVLARMKLKPVLNLMTGLEHTYFGSENYLPVYFFEELSEIFCKESGQLDEQRLAIKDINLTEMVNEEDVRQMKASIFQRINLYDKYVNLLGHQLMSPFNSFSPQFYKFFIEDTLVIENRECIQLAFIPRNLYDIGFMGNLYISNDTNNELISAKLSISERANLNFIDKIEFIQKYKTDTIDIEGESKQITYITEDAVYTKGTFTFIKAYGYSINTYSKPSLEQYQLKKSKELLDIEINDSNRLSPLTEAEQKAYILPDSLNKITWVKVTKYLSEIFYGGYLLAGPLDIGPMDNLFSFNKVEGGRFRFSGKTNYKLSRSWYLDWMLAYGTKDKKFKYDLDLKYSFNKSAKNPYSFPAHYIGVKYTYNTFIPGRTIFNSNYDRITISLTDIVDYKLAFDKSIMLQWMYETRKGISFNPYIKLQEIQAYGDWTFANLYGREITGFRYDRVGININMVFNGKWIQNQKRRYNIGANSTSVKFNYEYGFEGTHLFKANAYRKLNIPMFGYMQFWAEGGYIFGKMLSPYLFTSTTYNSVLYHQSAFNLMRVMEFFSDKYVQVFAIYNLNGLIFNRIPLIRKLKLREELNIKMTYGGLREENLFMIDGKNVKTFTNMPYVEAGFGFQNLFNVIGLEYVRRITYTEGLESREKWGIRVNLLLKF